MECEQMTHGRIVSRYAYAVRIRTVLRVGLSNLRLMRGPKWIESVARNILEWLRIYIASAYTQTRRFDSPEMCTASNGAIITPRQGVKSLRYVVRCSSKREIILIAFGNCRVDRLYVLYLHQIPACVRVCDFIFPLIENNDCNHGCGWRENKLGNNKSTTF